MIDATNYYAQYDGHIATLDTGELTSSTYVQQHLRASRVVKALNNVFIPPLLDLARPANAPDRSALPVAADDPTAKAEVIALLDTLGYDAVDLGALADSHPASRAPPSRPCPTCPLSPQDSANRRSSSGSSRPPAVPAPAQSIRELLAASAP